MEELDDQALKTQLNILLTTNAQVNNHLVYDDELFAQTRVMQIYIMFEAICHIYHVLLVIFIITNVFHCQEKSIVCGIFSPVFV